MIVENQMRSKINLSVSNMYRWLDSWCQEDGAYNGFVVHRFDLKRLKQIHETPWGHCAVIEGLISLYEKNCNEKIKKQIEKAILLQISRLDNDSSFTNAGFEDDRFSSLVHNSMADRALLMYYNYSGAKRETKKIALDTVIRNVKFYLINQLWNEEVGAFKFSKVDYYSLNETRYVANMNCVAIEVLIELAHITGDQEYLKYAQKCGTWLKTQTVSDKNIFIDGGISYGSTNPQNLVSIYTGLCLPGLCKLYKQFYDEDYRDIAVAATENLIRYSKDGYFCHSMEGDKELRYPYFIAGAGIILYGIQEVEECFDLTVNLDEFLNNILDHQYKNGAVENFAHYDSCSNNRRRSNPNRVVWEDVVPCLPWNAQLFRFLARNADRLIETDGTNTSKFINTSFFYYENRKYLWVVSWKPLRSFAIIIINKSLSSSIFVFTLKGIVNKLRQKRGIDK